MAAGKSGKPSGDRSGSVSHQAPTGAKAEVRNFDV